MIQTVSIESTHQRISNCLHNPVYIHIVPRRMEVLDETVPLHMAFDTEKTLIHYFVDQIILSQISSEAFAMKSSFKVINYSK